jgi:transposase-like protein
VAFDVFCGVGFVAGKPKLWLTEAFTSANPANWSAFLGSLPGYPERIVCDGHSGLLAAIEARWPKAELQQCEWHLQHALDRLLAKEARANSDGDLEEVRDYAENALAGPLSWQRFVRAAQAVENESLGRWIAVNQGTIETQFARRALTPHRAPDMPLTTAALDQITRPISAALYPRRYALKNRERLNRLLMLLQLHVNGDDDVQAYARAIRLHLEENGGRPLAHRRAVTDPANSPSLR